MPRYIDADELIRLIEIDALCYKPYSKRDAIACVKTISTADVAPRAEVAREIILEIDTLICCHANGDIDDKRLYLLFDELKKKYTKGENNH